MSKRKNSTYRRLQQATSDALTNRNNTFLVYSTIKHRLHNKPQEEVTMSWLNVCKLLASFDKAIDKEALLREGYVTVPIVRGIHSGFISVATKDAAVAS